MGAEGTLGFLGGSGPQGRGLALRLARAGHGVFLGSRDEARGRDAAQGLAAHARGNPVEGGGNDQAAQADVVFVTVPYEAQRDTLEPLADALSASLLVCCVNALDFEGGPHARRVEAGSAAQECAQIVPGARVVSAFHTVSAAGLLDLDAALHGDVPVCGDDPSDRERVVRLANAIGGLRGVHAGPLRHSGALEALTAMLISVNKLYATSAGVHLTGVDPGALAR